MRCDRIQPSFGGFRRTSHKRRSPPHHREATNRGGVEPVQNGVSNWMHHSTSVADEADAIGEVPERRHVLAISHFRICRVCTSGRRRVAPVRFIVYLVVRRSAGRFRAGALIRGS